ncbi:A/G-specific adenine glycosylase [Anaeromicropila populeti]|uniref:Adenine DNA glycosylase n=1 Tax=Anaeromicropila populeti TaxID=37658 RepID=A0A1I6JTR8_9FIRM|nr:A/G-specific adenine glycosylase [Anaeromicropila populeti]SFR81920.1 A/G-specific DNA-adenine glycosylase [Anaeromicropila populeti]
MKTDYSYIVEDLLNWYSENKRILPWREKPDPYYIWVSEIMLQQTRVEAVKGYFSRFISAFPTIKALSEAPEEQLLKLWEGLGYYNRVRNMQKAAQTIVADYNGSLPADYTALLKLSGIGSYTAGAIASIAFKMPVPAVDGNVLRVTKRLSGSYDDITQPKVKKELETDLLAVMPGNRSGDFNQALMDLGATICIPNGKPLCDACPLAKFCIAFQQNITSDLPVRPSKKSRRLENRTILVLEYQDKFAIMKRPSKGLLAGLWEFPNLDGHLSIEKTEGLLKEYRIFSYSMELLGSAKHIFSHVEWHMLGYRIKLFSLEHEIWDGMIWASKKDLQYTFTLPTAFSAYTKQIIAEKEQHTKC